MIEFTTKYRSQTESILNKSLKALFGIATFMLLYPLMCTSVHAEFFNDKDKGRYFKWVDEKGYTHYSQHPPAANEKTSDLQKLKAGGSPPSDQNKAIDKLNEKRKKLVESSKKRNQSPEDAEKSAALASREAAIKKGCETARQNLSHLGDGGRVKMKNSEGEFEYIGEEKIKAQLKSNQAFIKDNCN